MFKLLLLIPMLMALAFLTLATFVSFWIVFRIGSALISFLLPGGRQRWEPRQQVREVRHVHVIEEPARSPRGRREREEASAVPAILGIMVVALAIFGFTSQKHSSARIETSAFGQTTPTARQVSTSVRSSDPTWTETATGENKDRALKNALLKIQLHVSDHIRETMPQLEWRPSPEYIQRHLLRKADEKEESVPGNDGEHLGWTWRAEVTVSIAPSNVQDFVRQDRELRATTRMFLIAKVLAGLFLGFGVIGLYVRLDDYSKGYYRLWLGLGAAALAAGGVVLFLLF